MTPPVAWSVQAQGRAVNNPFKFGTIVDGEYFTDRVAAIDLAKVSFDFSNNYRIFAS